VVRIGELFLLAGRFIKLTEMMMKDFVRTKRHAEISAGESVRILRALQELSQNQLADLCGIPQSTISAIENDRVRLGVERSKTLARALKCHPAVLVFPGWNVKVESAA
jgi:DNA-binding XRE family transcriptional regulator